MRGSYVENEKLNAGAAISKRSVDRLIDLVNDLLDLERVQAGLVPLDYAKTTIGKLFADATSSVKVLAADRNIQIICSECDYELEIDRARIVQVLVNLLSNAVKFSHAGADILLTCEEAETDLIFSVRDYGTGIPHEYHISIFDQFQQLNISDGARGVGAGLGLAICKGLVEQHGGTIGVESEPGKDSRFWFRIPVRRQATTDVGMLKGKTVATG